LKLISDFWAWTQPAENVWDKHSESVLSGFEPGADRVLRRRALKDAAQKPQGQTQAVLDQTRMRGPTHPWSSESASTPSKKFQARKGVFRFNMTFTWNYVLKW